MRKIQIAISSDLCIRLTWNLTGSCGQQQRLRGWSRMVVKQFQDGGRPPFWKLIYRHISVKKNIRFSWNFVHSSRFWPGWTSRDQKWKSCIGQTPIRQNVFLVQKAIVFLLHSNTLYCNVLFTMRAKTSFLYSLKCMHTRQKNLHVHKASSNWIWNMLEKRTNSTCSL